VRIRFVLVVLDLPFLFPRSLIRSLLSYDWKARPTANAAASSAWFQSVNLSSNVSSPFALPMFDGQKKQEWVKQRIHKRKKRKEEDQ
jgi:hypothetical protein